MSADGNETLTRAVHPERSAEGAEPAPDSDPGSKGANALAARLRTLQQQAGVSKPAAPTLSPSPIGRRCPTSSRFEVAAQLRGRMAAAGGGADEGRGSRNAQEEPTALSITNQLRTLLGTRARTTHRPKLAPPCGHELSPGLQLVESTIPGVPQSQLIQFPGTNEQVHRSRLIFFDTETTGLAGGVGTKAFMIGAAQWRDDHLHIRQLYLTTLGGEAAMLRTFASWLAEDSIFVSYNGKSYDAPLLKGRYRIHRLQQPFESRRHIDLLHPVRRAYRGVWSDCRLQTIERNLLRVVREDDLPGSQAPAAWLAYLRGLGNANLARVVEHNRRDIWTLAGLAERLVP